MMMTYLRRYFISGLLIWLPLFATLVVIKFLVDVLSNWLLLLPKRYQPDVLFGVHIPGIGVLLTLLVIFLTGVLVANFLGKRLIEMGDKVIARIPLVRSVYAGVKQVVETLFTPGGHSFRKVLLVEYPRKNVWTLAFQVGDLATEMPTRLAEENWVSVYVPTTPNPTSGFLLMLPRGEVIELHMSVDQALKLIISLGVVQPVLPVE